MISISKAVIIFILTPRDVAVLVLFTDRGEELEVKGLQAFCDEVFEEQTLVELTHRARLPAHVRMCKFHRDVLRNVNRVASLFRMTRRAGLQPAIFP